MHPSVVEYITQMAVLRQQGEREFTGHEALCYEAANRFATQVFLQHERMLRQGNPDDVMFKGGDNDEPGTSAV